MQLVIASNNNKKRCEIEAILGALGIDIIPVDQTRFIEVTEDGETFAANAEKKARAFVQANGLPALADDSGLMVGALDGAPGVYSSRYAGDTASDTDNNTRLLHDLQGIQKREARFVCALHLAFPDNKAPVTARGHVHGRILEKPDGIAGFGYDPLFYCPELGKSFASANAEEKARVSHRGRALHSLAEKILLKKDG